MLNITAKLRGKADDATIRVVALDGQKPIGQATGAGWTSNSSAGDRCQAVVARFAASLRFESFSLEAEAKPSTKSPRYFGMRKIALGQTKTACRG